MKHARTAAATLALAAAAAAADVQSQTLSFDFSDFSNLQIGTLDAFDDQGGDRVLTGVSFSIDAAASWSVTALNYTPTPFSAGDWFAEGIANVNVLYGGFGPGAVERITGAVSFNGFTGDLGPGSGDPIFGQPGDPAATATYDGFIANFFELDASEFGAFTGDPVDVLLPVFTDSLVDGPNGPPATSSSRPPP